MITLKTVLMGLLATFSLVLVGGGIIFYSFVNPSVEKQAELNPNIKKVTSQTKVEPVGTPETLDEVASLEPNHLEKLAEIFKTINTPVPLNNLGAVGAISLDQPVAWSAQTVVDITNQTRQAGGLPALNFNLSLAEVARLRLEDMFAKGYFAHSSPQGEGVGQTADKAGYSYIALGENLALGDFGDHQEIITAWLGSPAHRDNMLARRYTDIGVAVRQGSFNGRQAVLSVQVLGTPLTKCFLPDLSLKNKILSNRNKIASLETPLQQLNRVIENPGSTNLLARQRNILEYNRLAGEFNGLITETKTMITTYNQAVLQFNNCAKQIVN